MRNLQYKVKDLAQQVEAFKSGEKYKSSTKFYDGLLSSKDREIRKVKLELAEVRAQYVDVRNNWQEVIEDLESEHVKALAKKDRAIAALWCQRRCPHSYFVQAILDHRIGTSRFLGLIGKKRYHHGHPL